MDILYYSNYCKHSQKLVQTLAKGNLTDKISFICIDKRHHDKRTNQTFVILENGSKVILPPNIHSVPAMLLINQKYRVLLGDEIMQHLHPKLKENNERATKFHGEPMGYAIDSFGSAGSNIMSEQYTSYSMSADELSAKGKSNNRPLYNYVSANDDIQFIETPSDTYRPDKLSNSVTIDSLQQQRMDEIGQIVPKQPAFGQSI
uniref:Glutaredoxin domain-containing protein n=1 Tax=viral metagenome TaxID=1070528 RepID=A0A6C0D208_9ZZZZ